MKTIKSLCGMLAVLAFTACSNDSDEATGSENHIWHVTLTASMGDATHRALDADGNTITASFAAGDVVEVVRADGSPVGPLTAKATGASTTLEGNISGTFAADEVLKLRYRSATANYDGQEGTLPGIAAGQDYAEGTLTVKTVTPLTFESNSVTLAPQQSITKFTFKDGSSDINVKTFGIAATGLVQSIAANGTETVGAVTGTLATPSSDVYVALRNKETGTRTYSFTIQDEDGNWYIFTKAANLTNGKNYTASVTLSDKLPALTNSSAVGTIGVVGGLPAIAISGNKAVALMNAGALCPEHYGKYYSFAKASELSGSWYVPTKGELESFIGAYSSSWGAPYGVNGRTFTIGSNTLFFPAAGLDDYDNSPSDFWNVSTFGCYWSCESTLTEGLAYSLQFSSSVNNTYGEYKTDALSVRPFHALPTE